MQSIFREEETVDVAEKEQPSTSEEQPPTTTITKKKKITIQMWLGTQAPIDLRTPAGSTGTEDILPVTKQELVSLLQKTPEKEQLSKYSSENVNKQDTFLLEEEGLKNEICKEEPVIFTTQTSQPKCTCEAKFKEAELEYIEVQKCLKKQLDDMFDINNKLKAKLKQQDDLMRKILSERSQPMKSMVSVEIQDSSEQEAVHYQSALVQKEMDVQETSDQRKPVCQMILMQTENVSGTNSEQDILEPETVDNQTASIEYYINLLQAVISGAQQISAEEMRQAAMNSAFELENLKSKKVSVVNTEQKEVSTPEKVGNQTASIEYYIDLIEAMIYRNQQISEEEMRQAAMNAAYELEYLNRKKVSGVNNEQGDVSLPLIVEDEAASIINEIHRNRESETKAVEETAEQSNISAQKERPRENPSLWSRIKKAFTPKHRRKYKDRH